MGNGATPLFVQPARWPAFERKRNSKVKGSSEEEARWGAGSTILELGLRGRRLPPSLACLLRLWGVGGKCPFPSNVTLWPSAGFQALGGLLRGSEQGVGEERGSSLLLTSLSCSPFSCSQNLAVSLPPPSASADSLPLLTLPNEIFHLKVYRQIDMHTLPNSTTTPGKVTQRWREVSTPTNSATESDMVSYTCTSPQHFRATQAEVTREKRTHFVT